VRLVPRGSVADFAYELPDELIAQEPLAERSASRLLVVGEDRVEHRQVSDLPSLLQPGDRLVVNDTRVVPARLFGEKARASDGRIRREGELFVVASDPAEAFARFLDAHGEVPLPPYITRAPTDDDLERYQTVYAEHAGAVAAPTAGLHVDDALLERLEAKGITLSRVTLHVGAGTFQPVRVENTREHVMHAERIVVSARTVEEIEATRAAGGRIVALGTTTVRALESAAAGGTLQAFDGETRLFITPGVRFEVVDLLLTNFHLPESTLLMLVSAFAGTDRVLAAYRDAVHERYRFFSYGDAMLLTRSTDAEPK